MNIVGFLEARIAEDEDQASKHLPALSSHGLGDYGLRVLAECAAKRAIIRRYQDAEESYVALSYVIEALAAVYKDHPDYQQEWAVGG